MTPAAETIHAVLVEVFKAHSALWKRTDCREAYGSLGTCIDLLNSHDPERLPEVRTELELAHAALQSHGGTNEAQGCIARAARTISAYQNENAARLGAA